MAAARGPWAIVLAGGEGMRLRPLVSRMLGEERPKQFVKLLGPRSLLRQTLDRAALGISPDRTVVVTVRRHADSPGRRSPGGRPRRAAKRLGRAPDRAADQGARRARPREAQMTLPAWVAPQFATPVSGPPPGDDWVHEIELDGCRILLRIERGRVKLLTCNRQDWTARFPAVAEAATALPVKEALLDGEVVVLDRRRLELPGATAGRSARDGPIPRLRGLRSVVPRRARPAAAAAGGAQGAAGPSAERPPPGAGRRGSR